MSYAGNDDDLIIEGDDVILRDVNDFPETLLWRSLYDVISVGRKTVPA